MTISNLQFHSKTLRHSSNPNDYALYRAALEWDLMEPIVIENREDIRSETKWHDRLEPYHHQVTNLMTFCRRLPVTLLADDVGLGKTISAGLVMSELISRGRISKILIVCPKLLMPQWREELDLKFGIPSIEAVGSKLVKAKPPDDAGAVITTYHSARLHFDALAKVGYEMLILDEAHKLRNLYGVDPTPQVALRFRKALADRLFKYVLMLTATPIHNRLWDLYSLIDLLTVARGHENPFGSEGIFARKYIADGRTQARQLKVERKDEFRSIVYSYMSRVRRADAKLYFPERVVELHKVDPTKEELELIDIIAKPIQKLNRLAQISILQALISSPHALAAQLNTMARKGTVSELLAKAVQAVVDRMPITAKLNGLNVLVEKLRKEQPEHWRMIVFTCRRETQITIQDFLESRGISCGLINGESGPRNQTTIAKLKTIPPEIHVIISTEAGSEGVNLQAANVLINYDLPWNPMIVEQRIGRIQRLASKHASVCIFNIILQGTFEEYIVGRLMEKLQLAAHAIGDVEALLEASNLDDNEEDVSTSFEEKIRRLVIASLAGKDVELEARSAANSIAEAKKELEREENNINSLLGGMDDEFSGPRCPRLPRQTQSMDARNFVLSALASQGMRLSPISNGLYSAESGREKEVIRFDHNEVIGVRSTLYAPGSSSFERLVSGITYDGWHRVEDIDTNPLKIAEELCVNWANSFGSTYKTVTTKEIVRCFNGTALMRVRATVAHDGYERLVEVDCTPSEHFSGASKKWLDPINEIIENPTSVGLITDKLNEKAISDPSISEFCRFYTERRTQEMNAAGDDARKRKKLEDDFTPRLELSLVGLNGKMHRRLVIDVTYQLDPGFEYTSMLALTPSTAEINKGPDMDKCMKTGRVVPRDCLDKCVISNTRVMKHLLTPSELSGRLALPEHIVICSLSNKRVLIDEVEKSAITDQYVTKSLLKTSSMSGKRAEPQFFSRCEFSNSEVLENEIAISQISGKRYRIDEQLHSAVSGKTGHREEFIYCSETGKPLLSDEAERCEVTGKTVMPGLLERCEITGKKVLASELDKSAVTGKKALKKYFVLSSLSEAHLLEQEAIKSVAGKFCSPLEAKSCFWSGRQCHPDDLRVCELTGIPIYFEFASNGGAVQLEPLVNLLNGVNKKADKADLWQTIAIEASKLVGGGNCKVEAAELSPDKHCLAISLEIRTWLGFKLRQAGLLYSLADNSVSGRVVIGKRDNKGWRFIS